MLGLIGGSVVTTVPSDDPTKETARQALTELASTISGYDVAAPEWFGRSPEEVRAILGVPDYVGSGEKRVSWEYRLLDGTMAVRVLFVDGYVANMDD